ncbi:MAG TPA: crotonase/enoyl-CoA hydratase family protein [Actinomycetota bacterium]|jgi:enoyl-CoA hydratase|nr:crotonase/enoyl-CoA hydratase family protein [Actinomycetota bacterium]
MSECLVERDGHTLIVTMNRPEARNALSTEMMQIMSEAWDEVNANPDIRVAILTGAGGHFCAGADLKGFAASDPGKGMTEGERQGSFDPTYLKPLLKGFLLDKPLIAAVEGYAVAGGTEVLQGTDIRVAGESAQFAVAEVRWGLFPLGGSTVRLRRQIPYTVAADMLLTGRRITAKEALDFGLIGYVVQDGRALDKAKEIAETISANGPVAVRNILKTLRVTECLPEEEAFKLEAPLGIETFLTEDAREGPKAFAEKRKPDFKGK